MQYLTLQHYGTCRSPKRHKDNNALFFIRLSYFTLLYFCPFHLDNNKVIKVDCIRLIGSNPNISNSRASNNNTVACPSCFSVEPSTAHPCGSTKNGERILHWTISWHVADELGPFSLLRHGRLHRARRLPLLLCCLYLALQHLLGPCIEPDLQPSSGTLIPEFVQHSGSLVTPTPPLQSQEITDMCFSRSHQQCPLRHNPLGRARSRRSVCAQGCRPLM